VKSYQKKIRIIIGVSTIIAFLFIIMDVYWLVIAEILALCCYFIYTYLIKSHFAIFVVYLILLAINLAISTRLFFFEVYTVPSNSMENALFPDDKILVSKLHYGPNLPVSLSEIPWFSLMLSKEDLRSKTIEDGPNNPQRLKGFSEVRRDDIVVFNSVLNQDVLVKRCVGLPDNKIEIRSGAILIDDRFIQVPSTVKYAYYIHLTEMRDFIHVSDSMKFQYYVISTKKSDHLIEALLTDKEKEIVMKLPGVVNLRFKLQEDIAYPQDGPYNWTSNNWGPIKVPKKGGKIILDGGNYFLYEKILTADGVVFNESDKIFYRHNTRITSYTFKDDYYIMMGDNRHYSYDSRFWGFVPKSKIIGKVILKVGFN
jgi:signal peptidase I